MVAERLAHKFIRHFERLEGVQLEDAFADWCEVWGVDYDLRQPVWDLLHPLGGRYTPPEATY